MKRALLIAGGTVGGLGAVLSITPPQLGSQGMTNLAGNLNGAASTATASAASSQKSKAVVPQATTGAVSASASSATPTQKATPKATVKKSPATQQATRTNKATTSATKKVVHTTSTPLTPSAKPTVAASTPTPAVTKSEAPTPAKTQTQSPASSPSATSSQVSGTFTGSTFDAAERGRSWGRVTVTVTMTNGSIVNISAIQSPSSRGQYAFSTLTPAILNQQMSVQSIMAISPTSLQSQIQGQTGASYSAKAYWQSLQSALAKTGL